MKLVIAAALLLAAPVLSLAQTADTAKPAQKAAAKPIKSKKAAEVRRSALKAVEEVTPVDDDASLVLNEQDLAAAARVYVGLIPCELGANVTITADEKRHGFFSMQTTTNRFRMHPVESRTGAIRLEDAKAGAMWLQLGNKSMLMSQKLGQRLADECMSPAQVTFADEMKKNPPVSILDPLPTPAK